jgi:hypothetical protein
MREKGRQLYKYEPRKGCDIISGNDRLRKRQALASMVKEMTVQEKEEFPADL